MYRKNAGKVMGFVALMLLAALFSSGCGKKEEVRSPNLQGRMGSFQRSPEENKQLLAGLVKDSTITQQQADEVTTYLEKRAEERRNAGSEGRRGRRQGSVQEGTQKETQGETQGDNQGGSWGGTQGGIQRDSLRGSTGARPNPLGELVEKGTITQEQSDKIVEVLFRPRAVDQNNIPKGGN